MVNKKVLITFKNSLSKSPRPARFKAFCQKQNYLIDIACAEIDGRTKQEINEFTKISGRELNRYARVVLKVLRLLIPFTFVKEIINKKFHRLYGLENKMHKNTYDLIYVADIYLLPLIIRLRKNAKVIFDAREYYPLQYEDNINFALFEKNECIRILKQCLHKCNRVITVSEGLASEYNKNFGILPDLILSLPNYHEQPISNKEADTIKIMYHGMANRNRRIENFIHILEILKIKAELHLYLVGDVGYIKELEQASQKNSKIFFHKPVAFDDIIPTVNQFDIGICYYEPTSFNIRHCLPNKFFEYIQARVVVAIGPSPDMAKIVNEFGCGVVSEDFTIESMVDSLNSLTREKVTQIKLKSDLAARHFCFEKEEEKFSKILLEIEN